MIYFDETATTKPSDLSLNVVGRFSKTYWGNPSSTNYEFGNDAKEKLELSRNMIANLINARPEQIIFTSGATEAANWIIKCTKARTVLMSPFEHPAVYESAEYCRRKHMFSNYPFDYMFDSYRNGTVKLNSVRNRIEDTIHFLSGDVLVAVMDSNNETGVIQPIAEISAICKELSAKYNRKIYLFSDMTQSFAHSENINVEKLGVDFAIASAQKFHAPRGVGFAYIRDPSSIEPLIHGGGQEYGLRSGTEPVPLIAAMAMQLRYEIWMPRHDVNVEIEKIAKYLEWRLTDELPDTAEINFKDVKRLPNIRSVTFNGYDANKLLAFLANDGILLSAGSACSTGKDKPSRILKAVGFSDERARSTLRITIGEENTYDDVDALVEAIKNALPHCKR